MSAALAGSRAVDRDDADGVEFAVGAREEGVTIAGVDEREPAVALELHPVLGTGESAVASSDMGDWSAATAS